MASSINGDFKQIPVLPDAWEIVDDKPHLVGTKCVRCGEAFFPPRAVCTSCLTDEHVERAVLGNTGRLYASTTIRVASKEFNPPYPFGYVILEPESIRIPTQITGVPDSTSLKPGLWLEMVIDTLRLDKEGKEWLTFKFRPSAELTANKEG